MTNKHFAILTYADVDRAVTLLQAIGFQQALMVRDDTDPQVVHHAEFSWNAGGGVMWATPDDDRVYRRPGTGNVYLTLGSDAAVDTLHERLVALGCASVQEPADEAYGGRGAGVRDAEGNLWSFGSYQGSAG